MTNTLVEGIVIGLSFLVVFVLAALSFGRGVPAILRLLALWIWVACKRTVRSLRLLARMIEQTRRQKDKAVRQRFERERTRRLRGPKALIAAKPRQAAEVDFDAWDNQVDVIRHSGARLS